MIAAIYARKSTDQNGVADQEKSVTRQIDHATQYAVGKGWTVSEAHIYQDDGVSGAEFKTRPGFLRLMNALTPKPPFQVLIMSEESRLGREMVDTMAALKQLVTAGVRVFYYLEDQERTLDSPIEKAMMALETFGAELERDKARQRTHDAMSRKAKAGHVTGGRVFGYDNVPVYGELDAQGRKTRLHVERKINDQEAAVVREIFERCTKGLGMRRIAKHLNDQEAPAPRSQQGRPRAWAPSSVREVLYRPLYRGEIVWNKTRKRNTWGQTQQHARDEAEWLRVPAPQLRIVEDRAWDAAHTRLGNARANYLRGTKGRLWGRPADGVESKYLLSGLARCGECGGSLVVRSRSHGRRRAYYYACTSYHHRGRSVCQNRLEMPLAAADEAVLTQLELDALSPNVIEAALERALAQLASPIDVEGQRQTLQDKLRKVEADLTQLAEAVTEGGTLKTLLTAIKEREKRRDRIEADLAGLERLSRIGDVDRQQLKADLRKRLDDWRGLLRRHVPQARQILRKLLDGRVTFTPKVDHYEFVGKWSLGKLMSGLVDLPQGMASPTGFEPVF